MRTIDINTTQNVTINYEVAEVQERIMAFIVDQVVLAGIFMVFVFVGLSLGSTNTDSPLQSIFYTFLPVYLFYSLFWESYLNGQSPGKKMLGIRVIHIRGKHLEIGEYMIRWAFRMVDIVLSFGSLAAILSSSSSRGQRLGDIIANTTVVKTNPTKKYGLQDILTLQKRSRESYEPTYIEVRKFSEADMLLIKNVLKRNKRYPNEAHLQAISEISQKAAGEIGLRQVPDDKIKFLTTLISDYVVLTR